VGHRRGGEEKNSQPLKRLEAPDHPATVLSWWWLYW